MEAADSLVDALGVAGFSDSALGGCAVKATYPAGGAVASAGTDMAGGKLGRQFERDTFIGNGEHVRTAGAEQHSEI